MRSLPAGRLVEAALLLLSGCLCYGQPAPPPAVPPLEDSLVALVQTLRARGQLPEQTVEDRQATLYELLANLGLEGVEPPDLPTRIDEPITLNGVYAYLRVSRVGGRLAPIADQMLADLRDGHYAGGILDLRGAAGQRVVPLGETFAFLEKDPIPIVCLIDAKTAPAPAQFAASLRDTYQVVLVGQPSAASLPPSEDVLLTTGERIRLPIVDAPEVAGPAPVQPDIAVASGPVAPVTSATVADWSALASRDPALRRAVDLLTSIRALRQR